MKSLSGTLMLLAGCALTLGCTADDLGDEQVSRLPTTLIWQSNQCPLDTPELREIKTDDQWRAVYRQPVAAVGEPAAPAVTLDFAQYTYSFVALGSKPNLGHGLSMAGDQALFADGVLTLPVSIQAPDPNRMYGQMLVSPCVVLATPKVAPVTQLKLLEPGLTD